MANRATDSGIPCLPQRRGGTFSRDIARACSRLFIGSGAWGDYDNDGDLDILLTGSDGSIWPIPVTKVYENRVDQGRRLRRHKRWPQKR